MSMEKALALAALAKASQGGGGGTVGDVQINGTSIVTDNVANIPIATYTKAGVMRVGTGLNVSSLGDVHIQFATESTAKSGHSNTTTIPPSVQHASAFYGLAKAAGDTTQVISPNPIGTYTATAKTAVQEMLGLVELTQEEYDALTTEEKNNGTFYFIKE